MLRIREVNTLSGDLMTGLSIYPSTSWVTLTVLMQTMSEWYSSGVGRLWSSLFSMRRSGFESRTWSQLRGICNQVLRNLWDRFQILGWNEYVESLKNSCRDYSLLASQALFNSTRKWRTNGDAPLSCHDTTTPRIPILVALIILQLALQPEHSHPALEHLHR